MASITSDRIHTTLQVMHSLRSAGLSEDEFQALIDDPSITHTAVRAIKEAVADKHRLPVNAFQEADGITLERLHFPVRLYNLLRREGIRTLRDLALVTEVELSDMRGMGPKLADIVHETLAARGFEVLKLSECTLTQLTLLCGEVGLVPARLMYVWQDDLDYWSRHFLRTTPTLSELALTQRDEYLEWRTGRSSQQANERQARTIAAGLAKAGLSFYGEN